MERPPLRSLVLLVSNLYARNTLRARRKLLKKTIFPPTFDGALSVTVSIDSKSVRLDGYSDDSI